MPLEGGRKTPIFTRVFGRPEECLQIAASERSSKPTIPLTSLIETMNQLQPENDHP